MTATLSPDQLALAGLPTVGGVEPECVVCGCTPSRPCPGGCGWDPWTLAYVGALVCTTCATQDRLGLPPVPYLLLIGPAQRVLGHPLP